MSIVRVVTAGVLASGLALVGLAGMATSASASTIVGQEYVDANYSGASLTLAVGSNGFTCTDDISSEWGDPPNVDASVSSMPGGWNDKISSFRGYAGCWTKIFEHSGFGGASLGYQADTSYVGGAMNDKTSSIRFS
jgi:hypothetical protein